MTSRIVASIAIAACFGAWMYQVSVESTCAAGVQAKPTIGTAAIAGRLVTNDEAATPVRFAQLQLTGEAIKNDQLANTDEEGRFEFPHLPAGRFTLSARKAGFVRQYYGANRPGIAAAVPIVVEAGVRVEASFSLTREGVIAGTLLLPPGVPVTSLRLHVLTATVVNGERRLASAGGTRGIGSEGTFRIPALTAGEYFLLVTTAGEDSFQVSPSQEVTFAPTFYPGTSDQSGATAVEVRAGLESNASFPIQLVPVVRVGGQVVDPGGQPPDAFQLSITDERVPVPRLSLQAAPAPGGRFSTGGVTPGQYLLVARAPARANAASSGATPSLWSMKSVTVGTDGISDLKLDLRPGVSVTGRMTSEAAAGRMKPRVRLTLIPIANVGFNVRPTVEAAGDGPFEIVDVPPGEYRLDAAPLTPTGWAVKSAVVNEADALDGVLVVEGDADVKNLVVTLTDRPTELSGKMLDSNSKAVTELTLVVFSAEQRYWRVGSRRVAQAKPATDGSFIVTNLPPGDYHLCAVTDITPTQLGDPSVLRQLIPAAVRIQLQSGEKTRRDLVLGPKKDE